MRPETRQNTVIVLFHLRTSQSLTEKHQSANFYFELQGCFQFSIALCKYLRCRETDAVQFYSAF